LEDKTLLYDEDEAEIEKLLETKDQAFVLFYESWCPFSQRFLPVFNKFAQSQERDCVKVVADYKLQLCDRFSVEVFPTVLFFEKGKVTKRLDGEHGVGLSQQKLEEFAKKC
jgi:thiol-disulfide isomerase/thioredoxin